MDNRMHPECVCGIQRSRCRSRQTPVDHNIRAAVAYSPSQRQRQHSIVTRRLSAPKQKFCLWSRFDIVCSMYYSI
uniref:Uncharacterized protein n=1 Tax=Syphacia muris TaxID=451379 RepID=A0A0N5B0S8_9BILA